MKQEMNISSYKPPYKSSFHFGTKRTQRKGDYVGNKRSIKGKKIGSGKASTTSIHEIER